MSTRTYESPAIRVHFEPRRCIHAAECVRGLPQVFDPGRKPWVEPGQGSAEEIAAVVERCPTGALHHERLDGGGAEQPCARATVHVSPSGPLFLRGDVRVLGVDGDDSLRDTRVALCRCGASRNKPYCDGAHVEAGFDHDGSLARTLDASADDDAGPIAVKVLRGGPAIVDGPHAIVGADRRPAPPQERTAFCRCGASADKPFCDGSHVAVDFEG